MTVPSSATRIGFSPTDWVKKKTTPKGGFAGGRLSLRSKLPSLAAYELARRALRGAIEPSSATRIGVFTDRLGQKENHPKGWFSFWRRGRDSNPRVIAHKLISSQPRYDHFDTSAYLVVFPLRIGKR